MKPKNLLLSWITSTFEGLAKLLPFGRIFTGEVIQQSDILILNGRCRVTLQLKKGDEGLYVLFGSISSGRQEYVVFELDEFDEFTAAVADVRRALRSRFS